METNNEGQVENEGNEKREYYSFYDVVRRMMLAGIGAVALKHDEIEEFIDKLVERGEIAKKDQQELIKEMRERHMKFHDNSPMRKKVAEVMERFEMPTKSDFDALNQKLSDLERKIDELSRAKDQK